MKSSCHRKILLCLPLLTLSSLADIAPEDSRLVGRSYALEGLERYPDKVFIACQTTPSRRKPVAAYRLRSGEAAALVGYKFDRIRVYIAPAEDWAALAETHGVAEAWSADAPERMSEADWEPIREGDETVGWQVGGGPVLNAMAGEVEASPFYVPKASVVAGEARVYRPAGTTGAALVLESLTERYNDGTPERRTLYVTSVQATVRPSHGRGLDARLAPDGRSIRWTPYRSGIVSITFHDAAGRNLGAMLRVASAGEAQSLPLPAARAGKVMLTARWINGLGKGSAGR